MCVSVGSVVATIAGGNILSNIQVVLKEYGSITVEFANISWPVTVILAIAYIIFASWLIFLDYAIERRGSGIPPLEYPPEGIRKLQSALATRGAFEPLHSELKFPNEGAKAFLKEVIEDSNHTKDAFNITGKYW
ncbi:hypothetical protein FJZ31_16505 [Candidatus Poribacteria bacterium]|nr:hypothetical protein [Candidatus Poribacteria bacterium]